MGDHFYLTLPSDAYVNYYPGNTASHFVAKLPERVSLEGNYEVGLSESSTRTRGTTSTTESKNTGLAYSVLENFLAALHTSKPVTTETETHSHPV
jgi:hypothetical protein